MECTEAHEAISALLDEEEPGIDPTQLAAHLAGCRDCAAWRERAHTVTRRVRLAPAGPAPTADPTWLAAIHRQAGAPRPRRYSGTVARVGLVMVAIAQIVIVTLPALIFGSDRDTPMHVAHEMGSFDLAIALGFLLVAAQPVRARGMHPLVAAAALLLTVTAVIDLAAGRTTLADEAPHLLVLAGWALMYRIAAESPVNVGGGRGRLPVPRRRGGRSGRDVSSWPADVTPEAGTAVRARERRVAGA
jgi:predicted anti-sigma-YlaC factor YlaD